ncbi:MAG TPA: hypothetical protein VNB86_08315 [Gaiellaceae bacterium]|jgi:hypothetical protein|nr:hypothetical protein [Gaiellaceae bacterium]
MRFKTALLVMIAAALALSAVAFAKPGKPEHPRGDQSAVCKHRNVLLKGTFLAAGTDSFTMNVLKWNRGGRNLKGEQTLQVGDKTRFKRKGKQGKAALADLLANDRLLVLARCKPGDTAGSFTLTARFVFARAPKSEPPAAADPA